VSLFLNFSKKPRSDECPSVAKKKCAVTPMTDASEDANQLKRLPSTYLLLVPRCPRQKAPAENQVFCVLPVASPPTLLSAPHDWPQTHRQIWAAQELLVTHSVLSAAAAGIPQPFPQPLGAWFFSFLKILHIKHAALSVHTTKPQKRLPKRGMVLAMLAQSAA